MLLFYFFFTIVFTAMLFRAHLKIDVKWHTRVQRLKHYFKVLLVGTELSAQLFKY